MLPSPPRRSERSAASRRAPCRLRTPTAETLDHGLQVGQHLTGVKQIGQAVDHRHRGVVGQLLGARLLEGADHDGVAITRQHARRVADRLATSKL